MRSAEAAAKTRQEAIQKALQILGAELHEVQIEIVDEGSRGLFGLGARDVKVRLTMEGEEVETPRGRERNDREVSNTRQGRPPRRNERPPRLDAATPRSERPPRSEAGARPERPPRPEAAPRSERPPRPERPSRSEKPVRPEKAVRPERPPRSERPAPVRPPKVERTHAKEETPVEQDIAPVSDERREEATALLNEVLLKMGIEATVKSKLADDGRAIIGIESSDSAILIGRKGRNLQALQYLINRMMRSADTVETSDRFIVDVENYLDRHKTVLEEMAIHLAQKAKETGRDVRVKPLDPQDRRIIHLTLQDDPEVRTFSLGNSSIRTVVISPKVGGSQDTDRSRRSRRGPSRRPRRFAESNATATVETNNEADAIQGDHPES